MARDPKEALNSYITDMLSLEDHIMQALKAQVGEHKDEPEFGTEIQRVLRLVEHHASDLKGLAERRKAGGITEAIKRAGSAAVGLAAGLIDLVRTEGLPKNLRDDYTAFSLAAIGYTMLYTTATALGDTEVASLAQQHLNDYAGAITRLNGIVPGAVLRELAREGLTVRSEVLPEVNRVVRQAWEQADATATESSVPASRGL
jgi:ferritin-like metal-binding protein YciE